MRVDGYIEDRSGVHVRFLPALLLLAACGETGLSPVDPSEPGPPDTDTVGIPDNPDAPVADAGEDFAARPLEQVTLDGSRSYDPSGYDLIPTWRFLRVPKGSRARLDRADAFDAGFTADLAGEYEVELSVRNDRGVEDPTPDVVVVHVEPATSVYVQLTWDAAVDLDLHVTPEGDALWGRTDCTWCNPSPPWGDLGDDLDDPSLDIDDIEGFGPETITIASPAAGSFVARVDYYGQGGDVRCPGPCPATEATLDVYIDGQQVHSSQAVLSAAGELWEAVRVDWPSGQVVSLDTFSETTEDDCR